MVLEDGGVVGRAEGGAGEAAAADGAAVAAAGEGVGGVGGDAAEGVVGVDLFGGAGLFVGDGLEDEVEGGEELVVEGGWVAGGVEVAGGEAEDGGEGVEFVFSFVDAGEHGGVVGFPLGDFGGVAVEGVGVGVEQDTLGLAADEAMEEEFEAGAVVGELDVGPDLVGGVAEPHGVDVAGDDEGVGFAGGRFFGEGDGGVKGVGEAIDEELAEVAVGDFLGGVRDDVFDERGGEAALGGRGALGAGGHGGVSRFLERDMGGL